MNAQLITLPCINSKRQNILYRALLDALPEEFDVDLLHDSSGQQTYGSHVRITIKTGKDG